MRTVLPKDVKKDLFHELRMLLGAAKMYELAEEIDLGNPVNYFKDSVFLHARAQYDFLAGKSQSDDFKLETLETDKNVRDQLNSTLWPKLSSAANKFIFHISESRVYQSATTNIVADRHLNTYVSDITADLIQIWKKWRDTTSNEELKTWLTTTIDQAHREAQDDYCNTLKKIGEWK